ncbi:HAD-IIIA family hydrolase [Candidatus Pelagibacter communis]|uniref:HAD-IIIA family hydrolase n=1 Tax=Pelagibacter ubique TaxID=198252 RepID=UPI00094C4534|nr:HAD-IIIA family hydrolase [Candidatus Pelagibacter ubique]
MKKIDLVILAGGLGSRLGSFTQKKPKPLIKINNKTFLEILIRSFAKYNFENIYILAGYKGNLIYKFFHNQTYNFIKVKCFIEKKKLGTWGAVKNIKKFIKNDFILSNGDSIIDTNFHDLIFKKTNKNTDIDMILIKNLNYKSNLTLNGLKLIKSKIYLSQKSKLMNGGVYFIKRKLLNNINFKFSNSIENDVLPNLIKNKKVGGIITNNFFLDIGTPKNLIFAKEKLSKLLKKPAIFLDRDGVINYDSGYTYKWKNFKFKQFVLKGLSYLNKKNYLIFFITNQAGIAKGYFKEDDFFLLHKKIKEYLSKKKIYINDVKYCPFHPNAIIKKYKKKSLFRKPGNLMIKQVIKEWDIDLKKSLMIGDKMSDKIAAEKSKLNYKFDENNLYKQIKDFTNKN